MKKAAILATVFTLIMMGCSTNEPDVTRPMNKNLLTGTVQKGPFIEGANVDIFEMDGTFAQTGKMFSTTIIDKHGTYMQRNMQLTSQFVELRANGYYYNEVTGKMSEAPLTLSAITDLSSSDQANINILTTLERPRIYQLLSEGQNFANARRQAHQEVLAVFGFTPIQSSDATILSIENDAMLLVVSAIVQGWHTTAEITQLITNLAADLSDNGLIDNPKLTNALQNNFAGLTAKRLIDNLSEYDIEYSEANVIEWLTIFSKNTNYAQTVFVEYPEQSLYGVNILADSVFLTNTSYSFAAKTPSWASLCVKIQGPADIEWYYEVMPAAPQNWSASTFEANSKYCTQTFTVIEPGKESILKFITPYQPCTLQLTFYEADNAPRQKTIIIQ